MPSQRALAQVVLHQRQKTVPFEYKSIEAHHLYLVKIRRSNERRLKKYRSQDDA